MSFSTHKRGFTLIELLLVIGIIALLTATVVAAVNPSKQLGDARNAQRRADMNNLLNAVYQYSIDNNRLPSTITTTETEICQSGLNVDCTGLINLNVLTGSYIVALPADPQVATATSTKYTIVKSGQRVTIAAPWAEQGAEISVTR